MSYKNTRHRNRKRSHHKKLTSTTTHPSVLTQNGLDEARLTPMWMSVLCTIYGTLGVILNGVKTSLQPHCVTESVDEHCAKTQLSAQSTLDNEPLARQLPRANEPIQSVIEHAHKSLTSVAHAAPSAIDQICFENSCPPSQEGRSAINATHSTQIQHTCKEHTTADSEATSPRSLQESFILGCALCYANSRTSHTPVNHLANQPGTDDPQGTSNKYDINAQPPHNLREGSPNAEMRFNPTSDAQPEAPNEEAHTDLLELPQVPSQSQVKGATPKTQQVKEAAPKTHTQFTVNDLFTLTLENERRVQIDGLEAQIAALQHLPDHVTALEARLAAFEHAHNRVTARQEGPRTHCRKPQTSLASQAPRSKEVTPAGRPRAEQKIKSERSPAIENPNAAAQRDGHVDPAKLLGKAQPALPKPSRPWARSPTASDWTPRPSVQRGWRVTETHTHHCRGWNNHNVQHTLNQPNSKGQASTHSRKEAREDHGSRMWRDFTHQHDDVQWHGTRILSSSPTPRHRSRDPERSNAK
jgi:hypothetical protein